MEGGVSIIGTNFGVTRIVGVSKWKWKLEERGEWWRN